MRALEETRSSPEVTIGRAIAIEHLGALTTRLRSIAVQLKSEGHNEAQPIQLVSWKVIPSDHIRLTSMVCAKILANLDIDAWRKLGADDTVVTSWLVKRSSGDILSQV
jgi:hypothetical protein